MRITHIETIRAERQPSLMFVQVHTDAGITGLGETCVGVSAVEAYLHETAAPGLIGSDPRDIARAWTAARSQFIGFGGSSVAVRATSAVDIALWDILGKAAGLPLFRLLGGPVRDSIRIYNTCAGPGYGSSSSNVNRKRWGLVDEEPEGPYEDLLASVTRPEELVGSLRDSGVTAMKIWPFDEAALRSGGLWIDRSDLREGVKIIERTRAAAGDDMDILLEMHSLWSPQAALTIARAVEDFDLFWIEDPFRVDSPEALTRFADKTRIPLTVGETIGTRFDYHRLLRSGAVSYLMFDVGWVGGISEAVRVASLAETYGVPVAPHDCTGPVVLTASVHLSLNCPNTLVQEIVRAFTTGWYREVLTELPEIRDGFVYPMAGPGLGTKLQPGRLTAADCERRVSKA